jgi:thiamine-phosphate pyrophosphorylase
VSGEGGGKGSGNGGGRRWPALMVISDSGVARGEVLDERLERVLALARPESVVVQLRDLELGTRERMALGERLVTLCRRHGQRFVVNDRVDLAVLLGADGVHLGERSVAPAEVRAMLPGAFISHACHDLDGVLRPGSDAAVLSPICAPRKGRAAFGVEALRRARALIDDNGSTAALYALGGIDAASAMACIDGGATGVAVIGAVLDGRDPVPLVKALGIERP